MTLSDILQLAATLVALATGIAALSIAHKDRRHATKLAEDDRRSALRQAQLMSELDAATRLAINLGRGGHMDKEIRKSMGTEALTLITLLGPERVPDLWASRSASTEDLRAKADDESREPWDRGRAEAAGAMSAIIDEIRAANHS